MEITKKLLSHLYLDRKMGLTLIARELGVGVRVVRNRLNKFGIQMRPFHLKGRQNRLGVILSDETKKKISESHRGKKLSPQHRAKVVKTLVYGLKGEKNLMWKGGISSHGGYVLVRKPNHPKAYKNGYVKRAVLVAEEILGRNLTENEVTHHINGDKQNDRPENIEVLTASQHNSITMKERWLRGEMANILNINHQKEV